MKQYRAERRKEAEERWRQRNRVTDPPKPWWAHPVRRVRYMTLVARWRLAVIATTRPVGVALAISLMVCAIPMWMLLDQASDLRQQGKTNTEQQKQIADLLGEIQNSRKRTTEVFCNNLNANARTNNAQLKLFQGIIVQGAKSSVIFESLYRQYGAPPYSTRIRQAKRQAQKIERLKLPKVDCDKAEQEIENQTPKKPNPPIP